MSFISKHVVNPDPQPVSKLGDRFNFGRHKGIVVFEVYIHDPEYLEWLMDETKLALFHNTLKLMIRRRATEKRYEKYREYEGGYGDIF